MVSTLSWKVCDVRKLASEAVYVLLRMSIPKSQKTRNNRPGIECGYTLGSPTKVRKPVNMECDMVKMKGNGRLQDKFEDCLARLCCFSRGTFLRVRVKG
jgi:hypothetical protein